MKPVGKVTRAILVFGGGFDAPAATSARCRSPAGQPPPSCCTYEATAAHPQCAPLPQSAAAGQPVSATVMPQTRGCVYFRAGTCGHSQPSRTGCSTAVAALRVLRAGQSLDRRFLCYRQTTLGGGDGGGGDDRRSFVKTNEKSCFGLIVDRFSRT